MTTTSAAGRYTKATGIMKTMAITTTMITVVVSLD
jgi:hypothetical protein